MEKEVKVMIEALENAKNEVVKNIGKYGSFYQKKTTSKYCKDLSYELDKHIANIKEFCK